MTTNKFKRRANFRTLFNGKVETFDDIFSKLGISNIEIQKLCKNIPKNITWFGSNQNIPIIGDHTLIKFIHTACDIDLANIDKFLQVLNGLTTRRDNGFSPNINQDLCKNSIEAFKIANGLVKTLKSTPVKSNAINIALEYYGLKAYKEIISNGVDISKEDLILLAWKQPANRINNILPILDEIKNTSKNILIEEKYIIDNFKTNSLLKKSTEEIEKWIDFNTALINSNRFKDGSVISEVNDYVPLSELKNVMHFKKMIDQLSTNMNYISFKNNYNTETSEEYITYTQYKNLESLINNMNLPVWGLKYAINFSQINLNKTKDSINKKELFKDVLTFCEKALLDKSLDSKNNISKKISKI